MFFRSAKAIVLAVILIGVGAVQLVMGISYKELSKREAATIGTIIKVHHGRFASYDFTFLMNGVSVRDDSNTCRTALSPAGCREGAPVRVYYDPEQVTGALLQEFGEASRGKIFMGVWMFAFGLFLIGLNLVLKRSLGEPDESKSTDADEPNDKPEIISILPAE